MGCEGQGAWARTHLDTAACVSSSPCPMLTLTLTHLTPNNSTINIAILSQTGKRKGHEMEDILRGSYPGWTFKKRKYRYREYARSNRWNPTRFFPPPPTRSRPSVRVDSTLNPKIMPRSTTVAILNPWFFPPPSRYLMSLESFKLYTARLSFTGIDIVDMAGHGTPQPRTTGSSAL